ncbi:peptide ABC transporter ATP-binding protein [Leifsonia sp. Root227]|uniref:ATP-binding cassette domain-containing protein n=1 Tax=Leifsonia sp. Root227 TaxID=1736496 RepID=UPI000700A878|nr:ATP-binding cassette domain-containing protein [Leifsonia sp. Root227]KRC51748.1 peptide ABC transporter ATP-binding protein [Leifsonia sp. Root227]
MTLLTVDDVVVEYTRGRTRFRAVDGVSISIAEGETLGLVGESGSGKTTLGRAVLGLVTPESGTVHFRGQDITSRTRALRRSLARQIQVVFQDPYTSLNPMLSIGDILAEPLRAQGATRNDARRRIVELLDQVHLPAGSISRVAREFSGGQRQRIAIARALAVRPSLIVCDEPVSALDLTTQLRVLELFKEIQESTGVAYLFISHDLAVIRAISHRVAVLYRGKLVEHGSAEAITATPADPYTRRLLMSAPVPDPVEQARRRAERHELLVAGT